MRIRDLFFKKDADLSWAKAKADVEARMPAKPAKDTNQVDFHEKQRLAHLATDRTVTQEVRDQAAADLVVLIGQKRADKLIGARTRLMARGWIR